MHVLAGMAAAAFTYGVFRRLQRQPAGFLSCLFVGLSRLPAVIGVSLLYGLGVAALSLPAYLVEGGAAVTLVLMIPALWLSVVWSAAVPAAVIERTGVVASLQRSAALTAGYRGSIFVSWLLIGLLLAVILVPVFLMLLGGTSPSRDPVHAALKLAWLTIGIKVVAQSLLAVGQSVVYHGLRKRKEGITADELVAAFE